MFQTCYKEEHKSESYFSRHIPAFKDYLACKSWRGGGHSSSPSMFLYYTVKKIINIFCHETVHVLAKKINIPEKLE
jgi:hypothetical protein